MPELQDVIANLKSNMDSVTSALASANEELSRKKAEHAQWTDKLAKVKQEHAAKISELEAKKVAADRSAEENARRIKLNNDQVNEITRIRADLDKREKALAAREAQLEKTKNEFAQRAYAVDQREAAVNAKEREINVRYAKMKEAMA